MHQPQTRHQRRETQRLKAIDRTASWRAERAAAGVPDVRAVDRAIAEAVAFLTRISNGPAIDAGEIIRLAKIVLVRDGYEREASKAAVVNRLRPRAYHTGATHMPSTSLRIPDPPRGGGDWHPRDLRFAFELASRSPR